MPTGTNKQKIAQQFKRHKAWTQKGMSTQWDNTRSCQEFYAGDFMTYEDRIAFTDQVGKKKRALVQFNKVKPNVDAVSGFMAQNRRVAKYLARLNSSAAQVLYSRYANALSTYIRDNMNADQVESQQDKDMLVNGYGITATDISYIQGNATTDPNGEIIKVRVDPLCAGWDGTAKAQNVTDRRWNYWWDDYDLSDALSLFQGSDEEDFETVDKTDPNSSDYQYNPYGGLYDKIRQQDSVEWADKNESKVRVYNYEWFEYETFYRAENPLYTATNPEAAFRIQMELDTIAQEVQQEGDMFDFNPRAKILSFDAKTRQKLVNAFGKYITIHDFKRKAFYTAVLSGEHVFTAFRSVCQQSFAMQIKTGSYNAPKKIWIGMVNSMMEPAKYYNKALTELMFTIASNSKGGVMIEEDAVEDVADFEAKWAKTDAVIRMRSGALAAGKVQEKAKSALPTGLENIISLTDAAIADTSGVDRSFLGSAENKQETGILFKRRIRQVISTMAGYIDAGTLSQKMDARLMLDFMRVYAENNDGAMFRILGEDGKDEYAIVASDKLAAEYDVAIEEAPQTPEDKQETAEIISNIADSLMSAGDVITAKALYAEGIQFINLDGDVKQRIVQALQPQQTQIDPAEHEQLKQQVALLSSETNRADVEQKLSQAELNRARIGETQASARLKGGQTAKTLEEAQKTDVETDILRRTPIQQELTA